MNQLISIEPADGDFVAYIDAMVGPPPEDPETAARLISEQLALRSRHNIAIMNGMGKAGTPASDSTAASSPDQTPLGTAWGKLGQAQPSATALPTIGALRTSASGRDLGQALASPGSSPTEMLGELVSALSRLMLVIGVIWLGAAIVLADQIAWLSPVPGVVLLFLGVMVGNMAGNKRRSVRTAKAGRPS